jgi:SAM-dependent methyltransferase
VFRSADNDVLWVEQTKVSIAVLKKCRSFAGVGEIALTLQLLARSPTAGGIKVEKAGTKIAVAGVDPMPALYPGALPNCHCDAVAVLQATRHNDDWRETGQELLRVLKPGRPLVIAKITLSSKLKMKAELDIDIEAWIEKIASRIGWSFDQTPYDGLQNLHRGFDGLVDLPGTFEWRGIEVFWARNKKG